MTKQEQIEKMAADIAKSDCSLWEHCPKDPKHNCISQNPEIMLESSKNYVTIATWLVNLNYRKVPEDAVVLTKEELVKTMESGYVYDTTKGNKINLIEMTREIERKETAKRIYEKAKKKKYIDNDDEGCYWGAITLDDLADICGVEGEE